MEAQIFTGHRTGSAVFHWVTVSHFLSFFCRSKVTETQSALCKFGEEWSMCLPSFMKAMLRRHSSFVCRWSCFGTFRYSHDRIAQKWAAATRSPIARWSSEDLSERMRRMTQRGRAFCSTFLGSSFLYDLSCRRKSRATLLSTSFFGSSRPCSRKVAATKLRVFATDF